MSIAENKAVARRYFDDYLATKKGVGGSAVFADGYRRYFPGLREPLDLAGQDALTVSFFAAHPDARAQIEDLIGEGDKVVCRYRLEATQTGKWIPGIPVTGKAFDIQGNEIFRIVDGRIAEQWSQFDVIGVLRQLGVPLGTQAPSVEAAAPRP
jgi:predicted ester cyclase